MDEYLVLEFPTEADAQACLDAINDMAATYWAEQGYTVVLNPETGKKELIGKNAATGQDMPDAARTITWDSVRLSPAGTHYFSSLRNKPDFAAAMDQLAVFSFNEQTSPRPS